MNFAIRCARLILLAGVTSLFFTSANLSSCTCESSINAKTVREVALSYSEGPNASSIIFDATVEKQALAPGPISSASVSTATKAGSHRVVSAKVLHSYRGEVSGTVTVLTGWDEEDCGFDFMTGDDYLIYADRLGAATLFTNSCTGTSLLAHAGPALRILRGEPPAADDLLDGVSYYNKYAPLWTGTVSGRITKPDGSSLTNAWIEMAQIRDEPYLPRSASHSAISASDGTFCIRDIRPGKYLLSAERLDLKDYLRWAGYFSGAAKEQDATAVQVRAGDVLSDMHFSVGRARVHTVLFRIVTSDGTLLPFDKLGVSVDAADRDALSYHLSQNRNVNGIFPAGYVPPGRYLVQTYIRTPLKNEKLAAILAKWRMTKKEMNISSDSEIVLKLTPAN
jgi:hypothetical protein